VCEYSLGLTLRVSVNPFFLNLQARSSVSVTTSVSVRLVNNFRPCKNSASVNAFTLTLHVNKKKNKKNSTNQQAKKPRE
jgi:hypothetical protein